MRRNRVALGAIGAAALVLVLWFLFLWLPQGNRLDDAREREELALDENERLELQLARLRAAQDRVPELAARLEQLRVAVPDQPNLAQFILDANDAAERSGIDFISISPSPPSEGEAGEPSAISLSISITGGYFQVLDFLNRLEAMPRLVVVDSVGISPSGGGGGVAPELSVALAARMFTTTAPGDFVGESTGGTTTTTTTTTAPSAGDDTTTTTAGGEGG